MARTPKTLTKAELKTRTAELKEAKKTILDAFAPYASDLKAAQKNAAVAQKLVETAQKKLDKAAASRDKGLAKIESQLAALAPANAA